MENQSNLKLGEILIKWGIIDEEKLYQALEEQKVKKKKIGEILVEKGFITEQQLIEVLAHEYNLPVINPLKIKVDEGLLKMFPYSLLKKHSVFPVKKDNDYVFLATSDPLNLEAFQEIRQTINCRVKLMMTTHKHISTCIDKYYGAMRSVQDAIQEITADKENVSEVAKPDTLENLEAAAQEAPVVKLVTSVLLEAIKQRASDIHFEPQKENLRIRFRIDGILFEKMVFPKDIQAAVISRIKILSGMDIAERRKPQDGRINLKEGGKEYDIRASTLPDIYGEKVVLRVLDKSSVNRTLDSLGMDEKERETITSLIYQPYGMILVTGPTGSGKTTTLYSILNMLNDKSRNIITVEDPVEYELEGINQTHINVSAGYTFATAIRHILRQDPDVIMIGEIRDLETAEIAIQAALTGHLVLSTLHTNSAAGTISRLLDMNVEPFLISSAVIGIIAQRLLRKLCPFCKRDFYPPDEVRKKISKIVPLKEDVALAKPTGCERCYNLGYSGRTGIYEILEIDDTLRELVLKRANESEINQVALSRGMKTLQMAGIKKALEKITSLEEVMRVTFIERK